MIVAFGQNGSVPGLKKMDLEAHMIVLISDQGKDLATGSIDKTILYALMQDEFDYANMIAGFNNGVQLVNFGEAFANNPFGEMITSALFKTFFTQVNFLKWSEDLSHVLLLIGNSLERTLCAKIAGRQNTFRVLPSPYAGVVESRHVMGGKSILLTAAYDSKTIYGIDAEMIVDFLTDQESILIWSERRIGQKIEDLAVVDGARETVILTLADGDFRLVPVIVRMIHDRLELIPSTAEGIKCSEIGGEHLSPIVRVLSNGYVIFASPHTNSAIVQFETSSAFGAKFDDMIVRSANNQLSAYRSLGKI